MTHAALAPDLPDPTDALALDALASRQARAQILDLAPVLIYVFDHIKGENRYSNRNLGGTLGYTEHEMQDMGSDLMATIIHPDDLHRILAHFGEILTLEDGVTAAIEYRVRHKDGSWRWLLSHDAVFNRDPAGNVTQHIGSASDITKQKEAEEQAHAAAALAHFTNAELRDFAYSISHDMKAPSNTMHMILSEMSEALDAGNQDDVRELMGLAQSTVTRMRTLVDDVLGYTQVVGQQTEFEELDLNALVLNTLTVLRADITARNAKITVSPLPLVIGSATQMMVLLQNLIHNAVKFTKPGQDPVVEVFAEAGTPGETIILFIRDHGIGIPQDKKDGIFQLFNRLSNDEAYDGSGIGLASCRRIALNHNTDITLETAPGCGATFSIELKTP